jgi:hypothetical protein
VPYVESLCGRSHLIIVTSLSSLSYRQRNVFLYPPQDTAVCEETDDAVTGLGECGVNGNARIFSADQTAGDTDFDGSISGTMGPTITTETTLVGGETCLLYQVFLNGDLFMSKLTTLTAGADAPRRTGTAQSFTSGIPTNVSFYRERRVTKEEFYKEMAATMTSYNILDSDACTTDGLGGGPTGYEGGFKDCQTHLEEGFLPAL